MYNASSLGRYNCGGYPIPFRGHGFPGQQRALGDLGATAALPVLPDPLSSFGVGMLQSPWFYLGLGLLGYSLFLGPVGRAKQRRKRKNLITPLTAGVFAAGAGAGGYLIGKYTGA